MSESEYIEDLKWVYRQCEESDDEVGDAHGITQEYNRVLEPLQSENEDNEKIQQLDTVKTTSGMGRAIRLNTGTLSEMKTGARRLLLELGSDVPNQSREDDSVDSQSAERGDIPPIETHNHNYLFANQSAANVIDIDVILQEVDDPQAREHIEDFRDEMGEDDPDESRLRSLYQDVYREAGKPIATNLAAAALLQGIDLIPV